MIRKKYTLLLATLAITLSTEVTFSQFAYSAPINKNISSNSEISTTKSKPEIYVDLSEDENNVPNSIEPTFTITNASSSDLSLKDVDLKYYYSSETNANQVFSCYYAGTTNGNYVNLTSKVIGSIEKSKSPTDTDIYCMKTSFTDGILQAGQSMEVKVCVHSVDWASYNKTNDYSYNSSDKVVLSINNDIISGTSPLNVINEDNKEDIKPELTIEGTTCKSGDTVKIPINLTNIKNNGMSKFNVKFSYDPNVMTLDSISRGDILSGLPYDVFTGDDNTEDNTIELNFNFAAGDGIKPLYKDGTFAYLYFKINPLVNSKKTSLKIVTGPTLTDAYGKHYSQNSINAENNPINILYDKDIEKDCSISENYFTYNKNTLKDIKIPMNLYENTLTSIENTTSSQIHSLTAGTDYTIENNILILKKDYLKTLLDKDTFLTINFSQGNSKTIFIKNKEFESMIDSSRSGFNNDEPNISIATSLEDNFSIDDNLPLTFAVTNTSNVNMELNKLNFNLYYKKQNPRLLDSFKIDYSSILGSNKDLSAYTHCESTPFWCDWYFNEKCTLKAAFDKNAGILKPGETVVIHGYLSCKDGVSTNVRNELQSPVITYNDESLYGQLPEQYLKDSKVDSKNIELDAENTADTAVQLKLNSNVFKTIEEFSNGSFIKTLEKDKDYVINKRNEIILKKSFLDSLNTKSTTLNFTFDNGHDSSINIINHKFDEDLKQGTLTLSNKESRIFGKTDICGGNESCKWNDLIVPISISDINPENISSANLILKFDKYLFNKVTVKPVNPSIASAEVNYSLGIINVKLNGSTIPNNYTTLFNVVFSPTGNTQPQKVNLSLSNDSYYITNSGTKYKPSYNYNTIELLPINGYPSLTTKDISAKQGETVTIPIWVDNAKYYNIRSFNYELLYDKNIFESASITPGSICITSPEDFTSINDTNEGSISVSYNPNEKSSKRITKDGVLMNISLKIKDDAPIGKTSLSNNELNNTITTYMYDKYYSNSYITEMSAELPLNSITILEK